MLSCYMYSYSECYVSVPVQARQEAGRSYGCAIAAMAGRQVVVQRWQVVCRWQAGGGEVQVVVQAVVASVAIEESRCM